MKLYYLPIILVILSNVFYHLSQKFISSDVNPILSLVATYGTALIFSIVALFIFNPKIQLVESAKKLNWASFGLGITIVGLELGFLLAYRKGWDLSFAGLFANVIVALVLIPIGILFFKEKISLTQGMGIMLSIVGLILISKK